MIKRLILKDFGPHKYADLLRLAKFNLLLGINGAGKTRILDSIAYGLLGVNHLTAADGKGAQHMIREGAEEFQIQMEFGDANFPGIDRTRGQTKHMLMVPTVDGGSPAIGQARILQWLGVPHETLLALLDATPLLGRDEKMQHEMLLRILRPPTIVPTPLLVEYGIKTIQGIDHLGKLKDDLTVRTLRDLRREKKRLEGLEVKMPDWPYPGWTETQFHEQLTTRKKELASLSEDIGALRAAHDKVTKEIESIPKKVQALSAEELQTLQADSEIISADLATKRALYNEALQDAATLQGDLTKAEAGMLAAQLLYQDIKNKTIEPHCPTCTCAGDAQKKILAQQKTEAKAKADDAEESRRRLSGELAALRKSIGDKLETIDKISESLAGMREQIAQQDRAVDNYDALQAELKRLDQEMDLKGKQRGGIETSIQKGEACLVRIREYKGAVAGAELHVKTYLDIKDEKIPKVERVIEELERIQTDIVGKSIQPFLDTMAAFLKPLGVNAPSYTQDGGFVVDGRPAHLLSRGQAAMFFEAAFRVAVAERTKIPLVVLDHDSPVSENYKLPLAAALMRTPYQVIMTWTTAAKPGDKTAPGMARFWVAPGEEVEAL